ncbi:hypothetical protein BWI96_20860 [Siphonobacter sp. SORGH_AS_0500]|uniref:hypothetical protein n=1 Tax=Siphonobacter sp. SORGH_AS_0500 TaxID=1864824 RepID=UPI000CCA1CDA|nr:hypothetical protein [Siphonobacter sp. SORGH_AS_0500]PKK34680.1 hypothetical protein BWI96_20860 [Siphonobacter sp. SORGH_AS_0500]
MTQIEYLTAQYLGIQDLMTAFALDQSEMLIPLTNELNRKQNEIVNEMGDKPYYIVQVGEIGYEVVRYGRKVQIRKKM